MKKSWKLWWIVNGIWLLLFIIAELFILLRPVDGAGVDQIPAIKVITTLIMLSVFAFPTLIQLIWLVINIIFTPSTEHKAVK